jgi:septum formation protein
MLRPNLHLASNSPRRRQLLSWAGWTFDTLPANVDESLHPGEVPDRYVLRLAESKARACAAPDGLVIAADTTVADGERILGKPAGPAEAREMLSSLRGREHQVYTALAVLNTASGQLEMDVCRSGVSMRAYNDAEIEDYIASGDPFDKAGAYAIQNQSFHPVEGFQGCYANVMGLPLCRLALLLERFGLHAPQQARVVCHANLGYDCPVFQKIVKDDD